MWPWGHLAVGYLCCSILSRKRLGQPPGDGATLLVLFGTQFPDLVDKPLAWSFHFLPSGRSLGHSLFAFGAVCVLLGAYLRWRDRPFLVVPFAVGYFTHLVTDALYPLLEGQYRYVAYLGWPLLELPQYDSDVGFFERFASLEPSLFVLFEFGLLALALAVWWRDGCPGPATIRGWFVSRRATDH